MAKFPEIEIPVTVSSPPDRRRDALELAIESAKTYDTPPGADHIVARAEVFLKFLDPPS